SWCDLDDGTISGREKCRACLSTIPAWRATAGVPAATRKCFDNAVDLEQVWPSLNPTLFALPRWKQDEGSAPCGDYTIVRTPKSTGKGIKIVARGGSVVREFALDKEARGGVAYFDAAWCKDVTGDGMPELMIEEYTGGAHCCSEGTLLSLDKTLSVVVGEIDGGSFGVPAPRRLDAQRPSFQLVGRNGALAYFDAGPEDFVSFACTSPFPRVLDYRGGHFVEATKDYPDLLRSDRQAAREETSNADNEDCLKGFGLRMLADSLLVGDWPGVRDR